MPLRNTKYWVAKHTGIPSFINIIMRNRLLVVTYHGLYDGPRNNGVLPATFVHVNDMADHLKFIRQKYHIITPDILQEALTTKKALPPHAALITFDDGYESFARLAFPVLREMAIRPVVFIATEYVENRKPFWFDIAWLCFQHAKIDAIHQMLKKAHLENHDGDQSLSTMVFLNMLKRMKPKARNHMISDDTMACLTDFKEKLKIFHSMDTNQIKKMAEAGVAFGGHTHTHTILTALSPDEAEEEILINKEKIENIIQKPCTFFAYPNGGKNDFNQTHKDILKHAGYIGAFSLTHERSSIHKDPMEISRINVVPEDTIPSLRFRTSGTKNIF
jgi:peptidoglycan/xylan/chitin deacetylase (PgdA/CDA1 family)